MKNKKRENFELFIISRFLVMLIFVVMAEFLVFFSMAFAYYLGLKGFPKIQFFITLLLFVLPIIGAAIWFSKIISEEVARMNAQEEVLNQKYEKARNLMLSDIAHDLRTPITTIGGYAKALNDGMVTSEEKRREYLEAICSKAERMNELITLLFDYVRLDSDNYALKPERTELTELLRENAALLYADLEEAGMKFEIDIPEKSCYMYLDRLQFSRVVTNLINNARMHNLYGTTVVLKMETSDEEIRISVTDNGNLIPEGLAGQIFEPFVIADASRESKSGSGLGLSIAKKIVEMHGWKIRLVQDYEGCQKSFIIDMKK